MHTLLEYRSRVRRQRSSCSHRWRLSRLADPLARNREAIASHYHVSKSWKHYPLGHERLPHQRWVSMTTVRNLCSITWGHIRLVQALLAKPHRRPWDQPLAHEHHFLHLDLSVRLTQRSQGPFPYRSCHLVSSQTNFQKIWTLISIGLPEWYRIMSRALRHASAWVTDAWRCSQCEAWRPSSWDS